jgi:hypothetical protein
MPQRQQRLLLLLLLLQHHQLQIQISRAVPLAE